MSEGSVTMEPLREALGKVVSRWYRMGLLRFNSHDDGSDDLLLRDELYHDAVAALAAPAGLDVERLARALHATAACGLAFSPAQRTDVDKSYATLIAAEYARLAPPSGEQEGEG